MKQTKSSVSIPTMNADVNFDSSSIAMNDETGDDEQTKSLTDELQTLRKMVQDLNERLQKSEEERLKLVQEMEKLRVSRS